MTGRSSNEVAGFSTNLQGFDGFICSTNQRWLLSKFEQGGRVVVVAEKFVIV